MGEMCIRDSHQPVRGVCKYGLKRVQQHGHDADEGYAEDVDVYKRQPIPDTCYLLAIKFAEIKCLLT